MAYQIDRFNGTFLVSVDDQTVNSTATDLRFVGRNYSGYGEIQNENLLHLLENFANTSAPPNAIGGQIWYDTTARKLKFYDKPTATSAGVWKVVSGAQATAIAPTGLTSGDFWWDTQNEQLFSWNGNEFVLVGPERSPTYGDTAVIPVAVRDLVGTEQQIIKLQVGGEVVAIISKETFTLNPTVNPITGFSLLRPGINFINSNTEDGTTSSLQKLNGTSANADRLGGLTADDFLRSGNTSFASQVSFKDNGLVLGDQQDLRVRILNGNSPTIESTINQPIIFRISFAESNVQDIALIKRTGIDPGSNAVFDLGSTGAKWKTVNAEEVKATTFYGKLVGTVETAPGPGGVVPPLAIQSVAVSGSFNMTASGGAGASNFNVNLAGSSSAVNLSSGTVGSLNNFNIGATNPGSAVFTTLQSTGTVRFTNATESTGPTSGALTITGGVGVQGALYISGNIIMSGAGGIKVPSGQTSLRPASPQAGLMRFNTTDNDWEGWNGSEWVSIAGGNDEDYGLITTAPDAFADYGDLR